MVVVLTRLPNWQPRLRAFLRDATTRALEPGKHDCCLFGAGAIEALTGVDLALGWRGHYTTFAGGQRMLLRAGYADHIDLIARHLEEGHLSEALPGDIAIVPTEDGDAVGVVQGTAVYVLMPTGSLGFAPMLPVLRLFKVR